MKAKKRSVMIGAAVALLFAGAVLFAVNAQHGLPGSTETTVQAAFDDVGSLRTGDEVRIAGVRVGQVGKITLSGGRALAELDLSGVDKVYRNATANTAAVGARSALGLKFVNLEPGTPDAGVIAPDQVIPASKTTGAQDITDLLTVLDQPTRDALGSTLRETGSGMAGQDGNLSDALRNLPQELPDLAAVSRALSADGGADTTQMLTALDSLAGRFTGQQDQIAALVRNLNTTLGAVEVDGGTPLGDSIDRAPESLHDVRGALDALKQPLADTRSAMTNLRDGAQALGRATPDVRGVLREAVPPLAKVPAVADQARPAEDGLTKVLTDARPLAPRVTEAVNTAADPLAVMAPYAPEIGDFFTYISRALSDGDDAGHWARFMVLPSPEMVTGLVPGLKAPLTQRDPYAAPGQAANERNSALLGGAK
jgi:phospholipid/cholesterol/gamma-HCH transport system substrate-binding protein